LNLELSGAESMAIIGESGTGKTTLALSIMRLVDGNAKGHILLDGKDLLSLQENEMQELRWKKIAIAFQNANNVLNPVFTVLKQVMEPMVVHGLKEAEAEKRAEQLLGQFGLPRDRFSAYPHEISGGETQRVLIAMALAGNPEVLILDEPLSSVDATSRIEIVNQLHKLNNSCTTLVVTHDLDTASRLAQKIAVLYGGTIMETGDSRDVLSNPGHPYTRALIRSYPNMTTVKDLQGIKGKFTRPVEGCPFHPRCTQAIEICRNKPLEPYYRENRMIACHRGGIITRLSTRNMTKSFNGRKVVDSVNLEIQAGETLAIAGESGSGKTTLAKTIMGLFEADQGKVFLDGKELVNRDKAFYNKVQMVFQNPGEALSHRLTVLESVMEPMEIQGIGTGKERKEKAIRVLGEVELPQSEDFCDTYPHHLSGGEMQRVAIARALVLDPVLLIADEPTAFLDASIQAKVLKLLLNIQDQHGLSIIFITHDIAAARKVSDKIAVMQAGKIVEQGPGNRIITSPSQDYTRRLLKAAAELNMQE
jgi:peptide/nickel transport system ATP-binding protein